MHLWEAKHSYYCNNGNYFANDCGNEFYSWESFLEAEGDCDPDYNLLFRWDWDRRERTLSLYWMGQRKGLYRYTIVRGMADDDESSVRDWLAERWKHLSDLWSPISEGEKP